MKPHNKNLGKSKSDPDHGAYDDFARAMELLKEDENMEKYYRKKYGNDESK